MTLEPAQVYDQIQALLSTMAGVVGCRRLGPRRFEVQWANGEVGVWALSEGPRRTKAVRTSQKTERWMGTLKTDGPLITCAYCGRRFKIRTRAAVAIKGPMPMHRATPNGRYCFGSPPEKSRARDWELRERLALEGGDQGRAEESRQRALWARRDPSVAPPKMVQP